MKFLRMNKAILSLLLQIVWRSFGLALIAVPIGAGAGAAWSGSWVNGALIAFATAFLTVSSVLGVAIASTGKLTTKNVDDAFKTAVLKTMQEEQAKEKPADSPKQP
jgi:hypothetical protein